MSSGVPTSTASIWLSGEQARALRRVTKILFSVIINGAAAGTAATVISQWATEAVIARKMIVITTSTMVTAR